MDVVDNYRKYDIPLETIWNDIDCKLPASSERNLC